MRKIVGRQSVQMPPKKIVVPTTKTLEEKIVKKANDSLRLKKEVLEDFLKTFETHLKDLPAPGIDNKLYYLRGSSVRYQRKTYQLESQVISESLFDVMCDLFVSQDEVLDQS